MTPSAPSWAELIARDVREALRLPDSAPIADIIATIEGTIGVPVFLAPLPGSVVGMAHRLNGRWYIVACSSKQDAGRLRFTIAHELGHVLLGHEPSVDDETTLSKSEPDANEVAANEFAAEFLLPRGHVVESDCAVDRPSDDVDFVRALAVHAGTTLWPPIYRMQAAGLLTKAQRASLADRVASVQGDMPDRGDIAASFAMSGKRRYPSDHVERLQRVGRFVPRQDLTE